MAIAITTGLWASGSTSANPSLPTTPAAGDLYIMFVGCKPYTATINTPTGWTVIPNTAGANGTTASGVDTGSVRRAAFYRYWQSGDNAPVVSVSSGNVTLAVIYKARPTAGSTIDTPVGIAGDDTTSGTDYAATMASDPGITANDVLVAGTVIAGNNATFGSPTMSATGLTIGSVVEVSEGATTTGNDLGAGTSLGTSITGTASAAAVIGWTLSAAQTGSTVLIRVRESGAAQSITGAGNIASATAFGSSSESLNVAATGLASTETHGQATLTWNGVLIGVGNIASGAAYGNPAISASVSTVGITSATVFGLPTVSTEAAPQDITGAGNIASSAIFGTHNIAASIAPVGIPSSETIGSLTTSVSVSVIGIQTAEVFGQPSVAVAITPASIVTAEAFGLPTLVTAWGIVDAGNIVTGFVSGQPAISTSISVTGIPSAEAFGLPLVTKLGDLAGVGNIASQNAFGQPALATSVFGLGIASAEAFGLPTIGTPAPPSGALKYILVNGRLHQHLSGMNYHKV
jgi:hypothetical protein